MITIDGHGQRLLRDALYHANPEYLAGVKKVSEQVKLIQHGRGVLVGLVAGLTAAGSSFDEAWQFLLELVDGKVEPLCVPDRWPSLKDYEEAKKI